MTHTLVAAFDSLTEAQAAKSDLLIQNVLESNIQLSSSEVDSQRTSAEMDTTGSTMGTEPHDESFGHKVSHFFSSLFGNDDDDKPHRYATAYPEAYRRGATLLTVTVETEDQAEKVEDILERHGAVDIDERSASWGTDSTDAGMTQHIAGTHLGADREEVVDRLAEGHTTGNSLPVIEEDLRVGKREVNTGRVRVVSRVTERPVEETVNLHEEHAHIERRPVDRAATAGELNSFKDGSIEIQETAEELVVEKTARVVEEVTVGKQGSDRQETVHDTVRRTDVDVEKDAASVTSRDPLVNTNSNRMTDR